MISLYVMILGVLLLLIGSAEFVMPARVYRVWMYVIYSKYFRWYGLFLIAVGFPLTAYSGSYNGIIFFIGIFLVLAGPIILIYPEMIQNTIRGASEEMDSSAIKIIVYIDATVRTGLGIIFILSYIMKLLM